MAKLDIFGVLHGLERSAHRREVEAVGRAICAHAGKVPYEHYRAEYDELAEVAIDALTGARTGRRI